MPLSQNGFDIYDLDQISCQAFGVTISEGPGLTAAPEEGFLEIEQDGPSFKYKKGAIGRVVRSKTNEPITKVKLKLLQTSKKNAVLSAIHNGDIAAPNGAGVGSFKMKDLQGTSFFKSEKAWIEGPPKRGYGPEADMLVWELACTQTTRLDGGN